MRASAAAPTRGQLAELLEVQGPQPRVELAPDEEVVQAVARVAAPGQQLALGKAAQRRCAMGVGVGGLRAGWANRRARCTAGLGGSATRAAGHDPPPGPPWRSPTQHTLPTHRLGRGRARMRPGPSPTGPDYPPSGERPARHVAAVLASASAKHGQAVREAHLEAYR